MRWEDERYVRLYVRDSVTWRMWCWQARALLPQILRAVDRAGLLELGEHGIDGLAVAVQLPSAVVKAGLEGEGTAPGLLWSRTVRIVGSMLVLPNYLEAQEAAQSEAQRSREYRARKRDVARAEALGISVPVTNRGGREQASSAPPPSPPQKDPIGRDVNATPMGGGVTVPPQTVAAPLAGGRNRHSVPSHAVLNTDQIPPTPHAAHANGSARTSPEGGGESAYARRASETQRDGLFGASVSAWVAGISAGTGRPCTSPPAYAARELAEALRVHADPKLNADGKLAWLGEKATAFARSSRPGLPLNVRRFCEWLDTPEAPPAAAAARGLTKNRAGQWELDDPKRWGEFDRIASVSQLTMQLDSKPKTKERLALAKAAAAALRGAGASE